MACSKVSPRPSAKAFKRTKWLSVSTFSSSSVIGLHPCSSHPVGLIVQTVSDVELVCVFDTEVVDRWLTLGVSLSAVAVTDVSEIGASLVELTVCFAVFPSAFPRVVNSGERGWAARADCCHRSLGPFRIPIKLFCFESLHAPAVAALKHPNSWMPSGSVDPGVSLTERSHIVSAHISAG